MKTPSCWLYLQLKITAPATRALSTTSGTIKISSNILFQYTQNILNMNLPFSLSRLSSRTCALLLQLPKVLGLSSKAKKKLTVFYDRLSRKGSSSTMQSTEEALSSSSSSKEEHVGRLLKLSSVISKNTKSRGYYLKVAVSRLKIA